MPYGEGQAYNQEEFSGMFGEKQGYDGIFLSCQLDIGLYEARTLVDSTTSSTSLKVSVL